MIGSRLTAVALLALLHTVALADWRYSKDVDQMTGKARVIAELESNNQLDLDYPYKGRNFGRLYVVQKPGRKLEVLFIIERGQLVCPIEDCAVTIRFDEQTAQRFSVVPPDDHSSTVLFINSTSSFIAKAKKAKRILVAATVYQSGTPVLEFRSVEPLSWPPRIP